MASVKETRILSAFSSVGVGILALCGGLFLFSTIIFIVFGQDKVPSAINMANNTGETVIVEIEHRMYTLESGKVSELSWFRNTDARIRIHKISGLIWEFRWSFFVSRTYLVRSRYYVQLEQNAKLYVLPYKIDSPVQNLPPQPSGYPLLARIQKKAEKR